MTIIDPIFDLDFPTPDAETLTPDVPISRDLMAVIEPITREEAATAPAEIEAPKPTTEEAVPDLAALIAYQRFAVEHGMRLSEIQQIRRVRGGFEMDYYGHDWCNCSPSRGVYLGDPYSGTRSYVRVEYHSRRRIILATSMLLSLAAVALVVLSLLV